MRQPRSRSQLVAVDAFGISSILLWALGRRQCLLYHRHASSVSRIKWTGLCHCEMRCLLLPVEHFPGLLRQAQIKKALVRLRRLRTDTKKALFSKGKESCSCCCGGPRFTILHLLWTATLREAPSEHSPPLCHPLYRNGSFQKARYNGKRRLQTSSSTSSRTFATSLLFNLLHLPLLQQEWHLAPLNVFSLK